MTESMSLESVLRRGARLVLYPIHGLVSAIPEMADTDGLLSRDIHASVIHGAYTMASTVVVVVDGSPPRGTLVIDAYNLDRGRVDVWLSRADDSRKLRAEESKAAARVLALKLIEISDMEDSWREMWFRGERPARSNETEHRGAPEVTPAAEKAKADE